MAAPPFELTPKIFSQVERLARLVGRLEGLEVPVPQPLLREETRVRTVQGSVAIEGNTLRLDQVTAILEGKRVLGPRREIMEVENAIAAYASAPQWKPHSERHLLAAHRQLTLGLLLDAGKYRTTNVGVLKGTRVAHLAPPPRQVPSLVVKLLRWYGSERDLSPLIQACILHYELQFIHPFSDGNGRVGRLWQHVALLQMSPVFQFVPVESMIRDRQAAYYRALHTSDRKGECSPFLAFSLEALELALADLISRMRPQRESPTQRLERAREAFGAKWFGRKDYLALNRTVSTASASRDLKLGVEEGLLQRRGDRSLAAYRFR
jgi:Fic family protein